MGHTKNLSPRQTMIVDNLIIAREFILDNLMGLVVCIVLGALLITVVRSCATTEAATYAYEDVRDLYNQYPELRPMISKALSPDNYLTKWEYNAIRDEKYRLWELERKNKALRNLQVVKDTFPIPIPDKKPIQTQEVYQPKAESQPSNGPLVIKVK